MSSEDEKINVGRESEWEEKEQLYHKFTHTNKNSRPWWFHWQIFYLTYKEEIIKRKKKKSLRNRKEHFPN